MKPERVLATVLFTDIVGSTERAAEIGDRAWRELLAGHHAIVRRELKRFGGRELTVSGDGFLATFERPEPAIRCACAIRDAVRSLGLEIRSGLHAGEVEVGDGTVGGIAVHTGARVAALAGPGEVLISSALRDFVAGSGFAFEERGVHTLKGVPGEWRLYAVTGQPLRLPVGDVREKVRQARLVPVLLGYLAVGVLVLWVTGFVQGRFGLPGWTLAAAAVLLAIGLVSVMATAWVQAHARAPRAAAGSTGLSGSELPGAWQIAPADLGRSLAQGRLPHLTWGRSLLAGVVAFSLLFGLAGLYVIVQDRGRTFAPPEAVASAAAPGIAVLPFTVRGEGLDVWREGMVDVLSTNLDGAAGLRAIDSRTVLARWDEVAQGRGRADLQTALEAARRAEARYALVGSAIATGPDVRFAAEIYDVESGERLGEGEAVGSPDSILTLVNQLSIEVLRALLQGTDAEVPWLEVATLTTSSVAALKPYLEGEALYRRGDFAGAVAAYQRALKADSTFALALYRLGDAYGWLESVDSELAHDFTLRAARQAHRLPDREALLLRGLLGLDQGNLEAIEILQGAVRRYPDDAEAWFLLGDTYYHLASQALVDPWEEGGRALARAVQLDPGFAPYYLHLMDTAVAVGDSATLSRLLATYARLAPETEGLTTYRLAKELAFGDAATRAEAVAALDTISLSPARVGTVLSQLRTRLAFPTLGDATAALRRRQETAAQAAPNVVAAAFGRGAIRETTAALGDPLLLPEVRAARAYHLHYLGLPIPETAVEEILGALPDTAAGFQAFYAGAYAADRGDWAVHAKAVSRLRSAANRALGQADSTGARVSEGAARGLEGYGLWRKGQPEALRALQSAQREAVGHFPEFLMNQTIRWWIGDLLVELDRPADAAPWFASLVRDNNPDPLAARRLGAVHERLGHRDKARDAYELFLAAWKDADPELQPMVEETRAALRRLSGS